MRLLTRSDFDGLISAALLKQIGLVDEYFFVHPKDVQDGKYEVTGNDVLANVPYMPGCGLWFDHHSSEQERLGPQLSYAGSYKAAPSCARVIWDYYGGHATFPVDFDEMMVAVDKCDSASLTVEDVEHPRGWYLLNYLVDPRTGLGRYRDYRISNYQLVMALVDYCRTMPIEQILELPDVQERVTRYFEQDKVFRRMLAQHSTQHGNVVLLDLREQPEIYTGNRFTLYTMFPNANVSVQVIHGKQGQNVVITCGHSIINRTSRTDVGSLMLRYGGGGHRGVGTCQVSYEAAEESIREIVEQLNADG
jgi:hypothetical protein